MDELKLCLATYNIDIVCITETHISKDIDDSELEIDGYSFFRGDRDFDLDISNNDNHVSDGGGSIIYYRNLINASENLTFKKAPDSVAINIESNIGKVVVACVYRSNSLPTKYNTILLDCIETICKEENEYETILTGDFNLPDVSWENGTINGVSSTLNKILNLQAEYLNLFTERGLTWCLTNEITRRRMVKGSFQESLLDQILATNEALVSSFKICAPLGKSDHVCIKIELGISFDRDLNSKNETIHKPVWSKITSDEILAYSLENIDWSYTDNSLNVEEKWEELHGKLTSLKEIVPTARFDCNNRPLKPPWSTSALKRLRKSKDKAWDTFDTLPNSDNLQYALTKQGLYDDEEYRVKFNYEKKLTNNLKHNSKGFYSYLRNKRMLKTLIPSLERSDGSCTDTAAECAEVLGSAFSDVFVREPMGPLPEFGMKNSPDQSISDVLITPESVKLELANLNIFKSMGPDGIHPKVLKSLSDDPRFVDAVFDLFRDCIDSGTLPKVWKSAIVSALYKSGSKKVPLNYRPVSLTCVICKVFEKLVRISIVNFLDSKISQNQHGFVKGKSCLTNLLETFDCIIDILELGAPVDLLYFDFSKAFDQVPHYRLLEKLDNLGIKGKLLNVIKDFLSNRTFRVSVAGKFSSVFDILSGIPQGSVLGPILFIIYVNDLPEHIKSHIKLFADDLKLICNALDRITVNEDLKSLEHWKSIWLLNFNLDKCKVLHTDVNVNPHNDYMLDGKLMKVSEQEKDLGILISDTLLWTDQINASISKANKLICWITRNVISRDRNVMLPVYKALIRPHLELCVQLWNPPPEYGNWSLILRIEGVQRRFTRMIDGLGQLPYSERLDILKLTTLAERRFRGDLIEVFKAKSKLSNINGVFNFGRSGLNLVSSMNAYNSSAKVRNIKRNFINERIISYWNKLPTEVKSANSVVNFKDKLQKFKVNVKHGKITVYEGQFWEMSDKVLSRIEDGNYLENKLKHNKYLALHPFVAKKKFINLH